MFSRSRGPVVTTVVVTLLASSTAVWGVQAAQGQPSVAAVSSAGATLAAKKKAQKGTLKIVVSGRVRQSV